MPKFGAIPIDRKFRCSFLGGMLCVVAVICFVEMVCVSSLRLLGWRAGAADGFVDSFSTSAKLHVSGGTRLDRSTG